MNGAASISSAAIETPTSNEIHAKPQDRKSVVSSDLSGFDGIGIGWHVGFLSFGYERRGEYIFRSNRNADITRNSCEAARSEERRLFRSLWFRWNRYRLACWIFKFWL